MSEQEYKEYVEHQQKLYDIDEDPQTDLKKYTILQGVYEQLQRDYQQLKQQIVYKEAIIAQLTKEKEESERTLNDVIVHTEAKREAMKSIQIEVRHRLLYSLALDWSTKPQSVFVCYDRETGEVTLKTPDEIGDKKPTYRHWWLSQKPTEGVN